MYTQNAFEEKREFGHRWSATKLATCVVGFQEFINRRLSTTDYPSVTRRFPMLSLHAVEASTLKNLHGYV